MYADAGPAHAGARARPARRAPAPRTAPGRPRAPGPAAAPPRQVSFELQQAGYGQDVQRIGTDTLLLQGAHWLQQSIADLEAPGNQPVGVANVTSINARIICVPDPFAGAVGVKGGGARLPARARGGQRM